MKKNCYTAALLCLFMHLHAPLHARSIHRPQDPNIPTIHARWLGDTKQYTLKNDHLQEYAFFKLFDKQFFYSHLLPLDAITYRNTPTKTVQGAHLNALIERLLQEIKQKKRSYTDFVILQNKGFNRGKACGLLILKFKDHPFVLKLFIETPQSFVNPWAKGFEPIFFFYMGGGVNRHLSGFTRIKNLAYIKQQIAADPTWSSIIDTPRKWFWIPEQPTWLEIIGENIGGKKEQRITIPAVYGIVADAIQQERPFSSFNKKDLNIALSISNKLESNLDLHITNFMVEKDTHKIVIIDTEHFPTMVGLKEKRTFDSYVSWIMGLVEKCAQDMLFCTKKTRKMAQQQSSGQYLVPSVLNDRENQNDSPHTAQLC